MSERYVPSEIEPKWQQYWEENGTFRQYGRERKFYALDMFPYPSGAGLHVGHPKGYIATDVIARAKQLQGHAVLHPMGWDAFGLPAEQYAIKTKTHPRKATEQNVATFKRQLESLGFTYDWDREINTTDPEYYKWTQWAFLRMWKQGLAFESYEPINWCPSCKTGLANEDLEDGKCERCGSEIEKKPMRQWVLRITDYADRLLSGLDGLDWPESIKESQRNWIGRSEGTIVRFRIKNEESGIKEEKIDGIGALIRTIDGKYLFQKRDKETDRDPGMITPFGGGRNEGETASEALVRELREELGITVDRYSVIGDFESRNTPGTYLRLFHVEGVDEAVVSQAEGEGLISSSLEDILVNSSVTDFTKDVIRKYQSLSIEVFTTRVDTLFGCTYVVVAPEHPLVREQLAENSEQIIVSKEQKARIKNWEEVRAYLEETKKKTEMERTAEGREKTGVRLEGLMAVNPINGEEVPVYVADYVLGDYGTGAVMAVPAHDERDFAFAKKYGLPIREVVMPHLIDKKNPPREGKKSVERNTVHALVRNPADGKFLCLEWKNHPWTTFIVGGVEDGEDTVEAARREVLEETGYSNLRHVGTLARKVRSEYFAAHKDENRIANTTAILFELEDDSREEVVEEEVAKHSTLWLSLDEIRGREMTCAELDIWLAWLEEKESAYVEDGTLIGSGEFDGLSSAEAREKITAKLEAEGRGRKTVKYKLRDWVFSRQRYWGEPIPVVRCESCAALETEAKLAVNFYDEIIWKRLLSGEKTIETRALNPDEPQRFFGDVADGDTLRFVYKPTGEARLFRVKRTYRFGNVAELFEAGKKELHGKIFSRAFSTVEELEASYDSLSPDYAERIRRNGLVGWELEPVNVSKVVPVPESELPVLLPDVESYEPTGTGESPLAGIDEWVNTTCPVCGGRARRETNTMPQWAGSSWYYLRYIDPKNAKALVDPEQEREWMPVDAYIGGAEHATRHLIYARFWHKFLFDQGVVSTDEPFRKLVNVGLILASDGRKMSKRWGNVVNPDDVVGEFGADAMRLYEMFMGPFSQMINWNTDGVVGTRRFLDKAWKLQEKLITDNNEQSTESRRRKVIDTLLHRTIAKVTEDIDAFRFNTAVSSLMELANAFGKEASISRAQYESFLILLSPFAPHIAEELWAKLGHTESIFLSSWPEADPALLVADTLTIVVQVNGKVRDTFEVPADIAEDELRAKALSSDKVRSYLDGKEPKRVIVIPGKLVNVVV